MIPGGTGYINFKTLTESFNFLALYPSMDTGFLGKSGLVMDVKEVQEKKWKLERGMAKVFEQFYEETRCVITAVEVKNAYDSLAKKDLPKVDVTINVY